MGRPSVMRAVKRTRLFNAGAGDDYNAPGMEALSTVAVELIATGVQKLATKVRKRVALRRDRKPRKNEATGKPTQSRAKRERKAKRELETSPPVGE